MNTKLSAVFILGLALLSGCGKDDQPQPDTEYPVIDIGFQGAFPVQCSSIKRGEKFIFKAKLSDNVQLGSASVDVHHNFDHHNHSTEVTACALDPKKSPVKPFLLIQDVPVPQGQKSYETSAEISVPADIDPGDYHFLIRVTDKEGWQTLKGISIKITQ